MIHVFYGTDDFSIHEALLEIKTSLGEASALDANTLSLAGAKLRPDELQVAVQALPFFGDKRLVIVDGLLGRFEAKEKRVSSKKSSKTQEGEAPLHQVFAGIINNVPDSTVLVLVDGEINKSNLLLKLLESQTDIRIFAPIKGAQLETWTRKWVKKAGGQIDEEALKMLVRLVGSDLWVMRGEIEKLVLYTAGNTIKSTDVQKLVGLSREASIFTLVDAIITGRINLAQQSMSELLDSSSAPSYILVMLARQFRFLVRAKELKSSGKSDGEIQSALGLAEYPFRKVIDQVSRYSMPLLHDFYHQLLETDLHIKTGKYDDELALTLLIADLCSKK